jgi:hypothetical protein
MLLKNQNKFSISDTCTYWTTADEVRFNIYTKLIFIYLVRLCIYSYILYIFIYVTCAIIYIQITIKEDSSVNDPLDPSKSTAISTEVEELNDVDTIASNTLGAALNADTTSHKKRNSQDVAVSVQQISNAAKRLKKETTIMNIRWRFGRAWKGVNKLLSDKDIKDSLCPPDGICVKDYGRLREFLFTIYWPPEAKMHVEMSPIVWSSDTKSIVLSTDWESKMLSYSQLRSSMEPNDWDKWQRQVFSQVATKSEKKKIPSAQLCVSSDNPLDFQAAYSASQQKPSYDQPQVALAGQMQQQMMLQQMMVQQMMQQMQQQQQQQPQQPYYFLPQPHLGQQQQQQPQQQPQQQGVPVTGQMQQMMQQMMLQMQQQPQLQQQQPYSYNPQPPLGQQQQQQWVPPQQ